MPPHPFRSFDCQDSLTKKTSLFGYFVRLDAVLKTDIRSQRFRRAAWRGFWISKVLRQPRLVPWMAGQVTFFVPAAWSTPVNMSVMLHRVCGSELMWPKFTCSFVWQVALLIFPWRAIWTIWAMSLQYRPLGAHTVLWEKKQLQNDCLDFEYGY